YVGGLGSVTLAEPIARWGGPDRDRIAPPHHRGDGLTTMESATNTGELAQPIPPPLAAGRPRAQLLRDYLALTKPRIISLLLITTVATMFVADPSGPALA